MLISRERRDGKHEYLFRTTMRDTRQLDRTRSISTIVRQLTATEPEAIHDLHVPRSPGFYAWWATPDRLIDAVPAIPEVLIEGQRNWSLLYVGIAPRRPSSRSSSRRLPRTLAERITSDHRHGNIGASTFRQSLASLLVQHLDLTPRRGHDRSRIEDERPLNAWMREHCRLSVVPCEQPWLYEEDVIRYLNPPLNLRPGFHPYRHEVASARRALRQACSAAQSA